MLFRIKKKGQPVTNIVQISLLIDILCLIYYYNDVI